MSISLEQVDLIMKRANVSYTEAKEALEQANGDVVEALMLLEKQGKKTATQFSQSSHTKEQFNNCMENLKTTHFVLSKGDHEYVSAPLLATIIFMALSFHVSIIAIIAALFMGFRISLTDKVTQKVRFESDDFIKPNTGV